MSIFYIGDGYRMSKISGYVLFCIGMLLCDTIIADALKTNFGLVKQGAFLLSKKPDTLREDKKVHSLVGYLPTGTRVVVGDEQTVTNLKTSNNEVYYEVKSELGIQGLLREDLLIRAEGRKLAVSIASFEIPVHQPNATLTAPRKRFDLGRYGGNYLEITGETEEGFYDVVLHRANPDASNLPATEKARLKKFFVEQKQVSLLDPNDDGLKREFDSTWSPISDFNEEPLKKLLVIIKGKINDDIDNVRSLITDVNDLQCLLKGSVNGELGFKVFSNGFAMELDATIKEKGVKYIFEANKLSNNQRVSYYSGIGVVKCDGHKPVRLQSFTIQEGLYSTGKRLSITLADLEKSKSKWITTLQSEKIANKMVRISGWNEYDRLMTELNEYAKGGDGYLSRLPEKTRLLLLNYIVSRIGYFEHRDIIVDPM